MSRIGTPSACAASRRRRASATMSASGPASSAFDTLHQLDPGVADVDKVPAQDPMVRLAPRVYSHRPTDLALAARLVDVPVDRQQRLALLDQPTHRRRPDRPAQDVAGGDRGSEVLV